MPKHLLIPKDNRDFDADCLDSINSVVLKRMLKWCKLKGTVPEGHFRSGEQVAIRKKAATMIDLGELDSLQRVIRLWLVKQDYRAVGIVSGFFLYRDAEVRDLLDGMLSRTE